MALLFTCLFAVFSILLLIELRRGPRLVGHTPHCRACGYMLLGNKSGRCPECGADLTPGNIVIGQRQSRRALIGCTLASIACLVFFGQRVARQIEWYHYRPGSWVIADAGSADASLADRAWAELNRRRGLGKLSDAAESSLTEFALATHAKPDGAGGPIEKDLIKYLFARYSSDKLSPAQVDRLYTQEATPILHVRPRIVAGGPIAHRYRVGNGGAVAGFGAFGIRQ